MRDRFRSEAELGTAVLGWLSQNGWDVYPEVTDGGGSARADIVAVLGPLVWVVECKMAFGLDVLSQAHRWHGRAHYVSVAVPSYPPGFGRTVAETFGIGVIVATPVPPWKHGPGRGERDVRADTVQAMRSTWYTTEPRFNRHASTRALRRLLNVGQKAFTAGAQAGFWTPYQGTCRALRELLEGHPEGMPVKDAIAALKDQHHYRSDATARASMMKWARHGRVPGVRLDETTKPARFVREEATKP